MPPESPQKGPVKKKNALVSPFQTAKKKPRGNSEMRRTQEGGSRIILCSVHGGSEVAKSTALIGRLSRVLYMDRSPEV